MKFNRKYLAAIFAVLTISASMLVGCAAKTDDSKAGVDQGDIVVDYKKGAPSGGGKGGPRAGSVKGGGTAGDSGL